MGAMQYISTLTLDSDDKSKPAEGKTHHPREKGLEYVDAKINGQAINAAVDTGATHNFMDVVEAKRLGLVLEKTKNTVGNPLSSAKPLAGVARSVPIEVGTYKGTTSFSVSKMGEPKIVMGLDFLRETSAVIVPHYNSLFIPGHDPVVTKTILASKGNQSLSAL